MSQLEFEAQKNQSLIGNCAKRGQNISPVRKNILGSPIGGLLGKRKQRILSAP
jgi:hypothetical protein